MILYSIIFSPGLDGANLPITPSTDGMSAGDIWASSPDASLQHCWILQIISASVKQ